MIRLQVDCDRCRRRGLTVLAGEAWLTVCGPVVTWGFRCPACDRQVQLSAPPGVIAILTAGGITARRIPPPAVDRAVGPAITEDDLIAFGLALEATPSMERQSA